MIRNTKNMYYSNKFYIDLTKRLSFSQSVTACRAIKRVQQRLFKKHINLSNEYVLTKPYAIQESPRNLWYKYIGHHKHIMNQLFKWKWLHYGTPAHVLGYCIADLRIPRQGSLSNEDYQFMAYAKRSI